MGVSIYYTAKRDRPIAGDERAAIDRLIEEYSIRDQIESYARTGRGHNGEDFLVYDSNDPTEASVVFEGATKLPDDNDDAIQALVRHWCELITKIRRLLPTASWDVHIDDDNIPWNEKRQEYDATA